MSIVTASAAWLDFSRDIRARPVTLVKIALRARSPYSALTLRLCTPAAGQLNLGTLALVQGTNFIDADGIPWDPFLLGLAQIDQAGSFMETSWQPVDCDLTIQDDHYWGQTDGDTLSDLLGRYDWAGTPVTIYSAFVGMSASADYLVRFQGEVAEPHDIEQGQFKLRCVQSRKWDITIPQTTVNATDWTDAPTDSIGQSEPIIYGNWRRRRTIVADAAATILQTACDAGILRGSLPTIPVRRTTSGSEFPKYLVADHQLKSTSSVDVFYDVGALHRLASLGGGASFSNPGGGPCTFDLVDRTFLLAINAVTKHTDTNGTNWDTLLKEDRPLNLSGSASMSGAASKVRLRLPDLDDSIGTFNSAKILVWYRKGASSGGSKPRYGIVHDATGNEFFDFEDAATPGVTGDVPSLSKSTTITKLTAWTDFIQSCLYFDTQVAGQTLNICHAVILVNFTLKASLLRSGFTPEWPGVTILNVPPVVNAIKNDIARRTVPAIYGFDSALRVAQDGRADDSGEQTGAAGTRIEHPVDVVWHLLRERGGLGSSEIDASTTARSFGAAKVLTSFYKSLVYIDQPGKLSAVVKSIGDQFLLWFWRCSSDANAPWQCFPWDASIDGYTYRGTTPFLFSPEYVTRDTIKVQLTPIDKTINSVIVNYDFDPLRRTFGGSYATSDSASITANGEKKYVHNMTLTDDAATATDVGERLLRLLRVPRVLLEFECGYQNGDLARGDVIALSPDWDARIPYPMVGAGGSWASARLFVYSVSESADYPTRYKVRAVNLNSEL